LIFFRIPFALKNRAPVKNMVLVQILLYFPNYTEILQTLC